MEGKDVTRKEEAQMEGTDVTKKEEAQMEGTDVTRKEEAQMEGRDVTRKEEAQMEGRDVTKNEEAQMEGKDVTKTEEAQMEGKDVTRQEEAQMEGRDVTRQEEAQMEGRDVTRKEEAQMEGTDVTRKEESQMEGKDVTKKEKAQRTETQKWGTKVMGPPAAPTAHPQNQEAAQWKAKESDEELPPYVLKEPVQQNSKPNATPMEHIFDYFNTWTKSAEELASNIWHNLKMAPSAPEAAMGKLSLTAKALSGGGFKSIYKQTFNADPSEHLKKTFACYLSTSTGPVAGTLYLTNLNVAFCSDRPLSVTAPSGQVSWSYYKVVVPLEKMAHVHPVMMKETPPEKYINIVTVDGHEFWFMGFVNYDKAVKNLHDSVANDNATTKDVA